MAAAPRRGRGQRNVCRDSLPNGPLLGSMSGAIPLWPRASMPARLSIESLSYGRMVQLD